MDSFNSENTVNKSETTMFTVNSSDSEPIFFLPKPNLDYTTEYRKFVSISENEEILEKGKVNAFQSLNEWALRYCNVCNIEIIQDFKLQKGIKLYKDTCDFAMIISSKYHPSEPINKSTLTDSDIDLIISTINRPTKITCRQATTPNYGIYLFDVVHFPDIYCYNLSISEFCTKEFMSVLCEEMLEQTSEGNYQMKKQLENNIFFKNKIVFPITNQLLDSCSLMSMTSKIPKLQISLKKDEESLPVSYGMLDFSCKLETFTEKIDNLIFTGKTVRSFSANGRPGPGIHSGITKLMQEKGSRIKTTKVHSGGGIFKRVLHD